MHSSLKLSNLDRLPRLLKIHAKAAVAGSAEQRENFARPLPDKIPGMPVEDLPLLLPVLCVILDPVHLDTVMDQLESPDVQSDAGSQLIGVFVALDSIRMILARNAVPPGAFGDLWTIVWPWMEFLDEYHETLSFIASYAQAVSVASRHSLLVSFIGLLLQSGKVTKLIHDSPGVSSVIGRAWFYQATTTQDPEQLERIYLIVGFWFGDEDWSSASFEDLVSSAGPTRRDLASLVLRPLIHFHSTADAITDRTVRTVGALIHFIGHTAGVFPNRCDTAFRDAFLSLGSVTALTSVSRAFVSSGLPTAWEFMARLLSVLGAYIVAFPSQIRTAESLRAGLLRTIFVCGTARHIETTRQSMTPLLHFALPGAIVYLSVLSQLRAALGELPDQWAPTTFADPQMQVRWRTILEVMDLRFRILDEYTAGALTVTMTCQNIECAKECLRHEVKACSGCSMPHYCSRACQSVDWNRWHRAACGDMSLSRNKYSHVTARDKSFLRVLRSYEYRTRREDVAFQYLLFIHRKTAAVPYLLFDYAAGGWDAPGGCTIEARALQELEPEFPYDVARTIACDGRMELHCMTVSEGMKSRDWVSLVRSTPGFISGLKSIADAIPEGKELDLEGLEEYRPAVRDLLNSTA